MNQEVLLWALIIILALMLGVFVLLYWAVKQRKATPYVWEDQ